jgi:uncharacterized membrane protein
MLNSLQQTQQRIASLDVLRGLIMIIMALDHVRDFFHFDAFLHDPLDLKTTSVFLFFTRWITHFCAPIFILLAGISIYLQSKRKPKNQLSRFLFKRGLWLVCIELTVVYFSWTFDFTFHQSLLQVIWAIGVCMMCMAALIYLPFKLLASLSVFIILFHNLTDVFPLKHNLITDLIFYGSFALHNIGSHGTYIIYPLLAWLGVMLLGYCIGFYFADTSPIVRQASLLKAGLGLITLFIVLRFANFYGNPSTWQVEKNYLFTFMSFINVHKYPPSLLYICLTIGMALIALLVIEIKPLKINKHISYFGQVPFLYYIVHFYIIHLALMMRFLIAGHDINEPTPDIWGITFKFQQIGVGDSLAMVYLYWLVLILLLYPICKWFAQYKQSDKKWWLSYL